MKLKFLFFIIALVVIPRLDRGICAASPASPIDNFDKVSKGVYRGEKFNEEVDYVFLSERGVTTVINLQEKESVDDLELCEKYKINCAHFPIKLFWPLSDKFFNYEMLQSAYAYLIFHIKKEGVVYFHCYFGSDRTGALATLVTLRDETCDKEYDADALWTKVNGDLENHGFHKEFYPFLKKQLKDWTYEPPQWLCE